MNQVMQKCGELREILEKKIATNTSLQDQLQAGLADVRAQKEELAKKTADIVAREKAVKGIEDVVKLNEGTKAIADKAYKDMKELSIQRNAFIEAQARVSKEQSMRGQELANKEAVLKGKADELAQKESKLDDIITNKIKEILKK